MQILVVALVIPMHDRSAGGLRFFSILKVLAEDHELILHPIALQWQLEKLDSADISRYRKNLEVLGIKITDGSWASGINALKAKSLDIAFFEHYESVNQKFVEELRIANPRTRIFVDTVDVAFNRLQLKAKVTSKPEDINNAAAVKEAELRAYLLADVVIGISHADALILLKEKPKLYIEIIPLIYQIKPLIEKSNDLPRRSILFVADFGHDANVDGILYFCREVLPLIVRDIPDVRLRVIGASPPPEVTELAGPNVEVLGFVPDLSLFYLSSDVSVAPMRFGGGLKGKIAEAMSFGLPVVSNSASLQGFGITAGKEALVGDDAPAFAKGVTNLLLNPKIYTDVRQEGWSFVKANYSREAVETTIKGLLARVDSLPLRRLPIGKRLARKAWSILDRHVLWRFQ